MTLLVMHNSSLETLDHTFIIPGHIHIKGNIDHSIIEKKKRKYNGQIVRIRDWVTLNANAESKTCKLLKWKHQVLLTVHLFLNMCLQTGKSTQVVKI